MFLVEPGLAALSLLPVPFVVLVAARYGRRSRPALQEVQQRIAELTADVEENVSGVRVVKAFAAEPRQLERFEQSVARVFDQSMIATRLRAFYNPFIGFLPSVGLAVVLFMGGRQVIDGRLSLGDFTAFYTYLLMLIEPMRTLGFALGMAQRATASGARLFEILDRAPEVVAPPGAPPLPEGRGRVELRHVTFTYAQANAPALRGRRPGRRGGHDGGAGGRHRLGQDDARAAPRAALRRRRGRGAGRRRRRARGRPRRPARLDLRRRRRPVPVQRDRAREHRLRAAGGDARGGRAGGGARAGGRLRRRAAGGLRHARRRARPHAVGRAAPADRDRPRAAQRPAHPRARRRDVVRGRLDGAGDQAGAARGDGRADDVRHRPPALDDRARRRDRRARARADRRARDARRAARDLASSTRRSPRRGCPTRSSSTAIRANGWRSCEPARRPRPPLAADRRARPQAARPARAAAAVPRAHHPHVRRADRGHGRRARAAAAGQARDRRRHHAGRHADAHVGRAGLPGLRARLLGRVVRADVPRRLGRAAGAAGPAHPALRPPAVALGRLLLAAPGRRADLADDQRRPGARPARLRRRRDPVRLDADAGRHRGDPRPARLAARAAVLPRLPRAGDRLAGLPDHQRRRVPGDAREGRGDHRVPAGDALRRAGRARLRAGAAPRAGASPGSTTRTTSRT